MSGHSKWATIKRSKGAADAKRGQLFTKIGHEIVVAVRESGPDPESNFRLRLILDKARQANMPKDNIDRAIKRGSGAAGGGVDLVEALYEGYGPHGTAVIVETLSDNRNRTVSDVRRSFSRHGGNLGADGSVAWMFSRKGLIEIDASESDADEISLMAIDAGAEDVESSDDVVTIYTNPRDLKTVQEALADSYTIETAELAWVPATLMNLGDKEAFQTMRMIDELEELEDVQNVYTNLDITDELAAKYEAETE
ncbi:MAG: YebC/PmpR family DNA-binding transcriptional regulator [Chloroflexi bacterium]|nr:YebC/PmpR family DNA-binding transcriptional regulator [Chloroflexota bacterium]